MKTFVVFVIDFLIILIINHVPNWPNLFKSDDDNYYTAVISSLVVVITYRYIFFPLFFSPLIHNVKFLLIYYCVAYIHINKYSVYNIVRIIYAYLYCNMSLR